MMMMMRRRVMVVVVGVVMALVVVVMVIINKILRINRERRPVQTWYTLAVQILWNLHQIIFIFFFFLSQETLR